MLQFLKKRLTTGWTFIRALYTGVGLALVAQAFTGGHWMGMVIGFYFAMMGILAVGCASGGSCYGGYCEPSSADTAQGPPDQIKFEEITTQKPS